MDMLYVEKKVHLTEIGAAKKIALSCVQHYFFLVASPVYSIISINISLNTLTMNYGRNKHTFSKNKLHTLICLYV